MGVNLFGLTANSVRAHMFPQLSDFDANSSPTLTIAAECVEEEAGELAAKLYTEGVTASAIVSTLDANSLHSAAWLWCVRTLRLMVALQLLKRMSQQFPELAKAYQTELDVRLKDLAATGATALGDEALDTGDSPADGPTTHLNQYSLTVDDADDMSSAVPSLRKDDAL